MPGDAPLLLLERFVDDAERPLVELFDRSLPLDDFPPFAADFDDGLFPDVADVFAFVDERPLADRGRGLDDEERFGRAGFATVSAAAPIAPTAAPVAAPLIISAATSITLSITRDAVVFAEPELFLPDVDDVFVLPDLDEVVLLAISIASQCSFSNCL